MVDPAPTKELSPNSTGAMIVELDPTKTLFPIVVLNFLAIIIHCDGSCTKVDVATNLAVANVSQMTSFGIFANRRTFDFDKVSNMDIFGEARTLDEYEQMVPTVTPSATVLSSIIELVMTAPAPISLSTI